VPAVCSNIPGLQDLITDGKNGYLVEQGNVKAMAVAVSGVLADPDLHKTLSENAKKMVARFDKAEVGKKWKHLINTLLENHGDMHAKLGKGLAYHIGDYKGFSRILFDELGRVAAINLSERNDLIVARDEAGASIIHKTKRRLGKLRRSVK